MAVLKKYTATFTPNVIKSKQIKEGGKQLVSEVEFTINAHETANSSNTGMRRSTGGGGVGGKAADLTATYAEQTNQAGNGGAGVGPAGG